MGAGGAARAAIKVPIQLLQAGESRVNSFVLHRCALAPPPTNDRALGWLRDALAGMPYRVHRPEGTFFFWLWFEGLSITSLELYERLKARNVLMVPGNYFFPGLDEAWGHRDECMRLNYSGEDRVVEEGIGVLADELKKTGY